MVQAGVVELQLLLVLFKYLVSSTLKGRFTYTTLQPVRVKPTP